MVSVVKAAIAIILTTCLLASAGLAEAQPNKISLERTACFGTCPVYTLTVYSDGRVEYEGKDHVKEKGSRSLKIDGKLFQRLMKKVDEIAFFKLEDRYEGRVTDLPTRITTVTKGDVTKTVRNYYGGPKGLHDLEQLIDEVTNSAQWTGAHPDTEGLSR
ncbi:MAG: hypothetical protein QOD12_1944 [Verrucomicrobiota bacterium]|jgi:hypothetical protein